MYKLIIVDDELGARETLREYIKKFVDGFEIAGSFESGEMAIDYLRSNSVDVVLTDIKMPRVTGIDIAKYLYENQPKTKIVIISGFGEFEYAQAAMRYGVVYYLLKVVDVNELVEIMGKIKVSLDASNGNTAIDEGMFLKREKFFFDLILKGFDSYGDVKEKYATLNFIFPIDDVVCEVIELEFSNLEDYISKKWHYEKDILKYTITNVVDFIDGVHHSIMFKFSSDKSIMLVMREKGSESINIKRIEYELYDILGLRIKVISVKQKSFFELYEEDSSGLYSGHELEELQVSKAIEKVDLNHDGESNKNIKTEIIQKAKEYTIENISRNISRTDVADHIFLNSAYFGRIFKEVTSISFSEYLLNLRMNRAVKKLVQGEKIESVCKSIGYSDVRSFRRVFKLYTGYTPSEYKENFESRE